MASLLLLHLLGCATPFEGTWLFQVERNVALTGDCAPDEDDSSSYSYIGTQNFWADIYRLQSGEYAVLLGEALIGTAEGSALQASWEEAYTSDDYEYRESIEFDGALEGNVLSGTITEKASENSGGDTYACTSKVDYTAERTTSSPDSYPGN
jgi:hypothetical protein